MDDKVFDQMVTFIYVSDLLQSKAFYEGILNFPLRLDQGRCRIVETNQKGGGLLGYCVKDEYLREAERSFIITLVTPAVDEWYQYLVGRGVDVLGPPKHNQDFNIYHFFFRDPDGYLLEIQEFRDPNWKN